MSTFHPTAIPLIACDPYFSVWSFTEKATDDATRHWTGSAQSMLGILAVDGVEYRFLGTNHGIVYGHDAPALKQVSVKVNPTTTVYTFDHPLCTLKAYFMTPLLLDRPEVMSRPVSYFTYEISPKQEGHTFSVYFELSATLSGDYSENAGYRVKLNPGDASVGYANQNILNRCGDDLRIDWGYLHLVHENATAKLPFARSTGVISRLEAEPITDTDKIYQALPKKTPVLCTHSDHLSDTFVFAYDDIHSIQMNHQPVDAYYKLKYKTFEKMLAVASSEKEIAKLRRLTAKFDRKLISELKEVSSDYANICSLAYRQAISAHKTVAVDGKIYFLSKECYSNGCLATLDVTYPSIPLFLLFNPELVRGMMRPLFDYARSEQWPFPYAPHDCGKYPFCNGQVYSTTPDGKVTEEKQMPVEECGNAILTMSAIYAVDKDRAFLDENKDLLSKWADYLVKYGYDPANQLCTDDFAGRLAHNCNLSLKAICALGAYAKLFNAPKYATIAKEMADAWIVDAKKKEGKGYRLTFVNDDTWSLKYNIIWDRLLGLNLFDKSVSEEEISVYKEKTNRYGVPLDSRSDYTKLDWIMWTTAMTDDREYLDLQCRAICDYIGETADRVPLCDWYYSSTGFERSFQGRSVVGGLFINLLKKKLLNK